MQLGEIFFFTNSLLAMVEQIFFSYLQNRKFELVCETWMGRAKDYDKFVYDVKSRWSIPYSKKKWIEKSSGGETKDEVGRREILAR